MTSIEFSSAGNYLELTVSVNRSVYGIANGQTFFGMIGRLIEVPALILLVRGAIMFRKKWFFTSSEAEL
ncbi:hypothetical protein EHQ12_14635 [Leptospira gomenensis]|uniref:Uncharacterized protein n=1 Tax=Leptospira gomenensis TaxID=2484974 RepID=A0A5F1Y9Z5_9LEPT|nr:hypothetical protein [Leptospira gomenensis]TGK31725.1 hypothetical protein EHQ17_13160 [Leptospira gomenensis]TGK36104.1 hypothetical protein EHQ12_14635 [Leptospira gomenensis]TGK41646.1 hypothetical protein EHQ07_16310 [Leptospira gomenensis]TGK61394.1 hypothetical protein EHQ13_08555 [Leptospira gomenensis]